MGDFGPYREKPQEVINYNVGGLPPVWVEMPCGGLPPEKKAFVNAREWRDPL